MTAYALDHLKGFSILGEDAMAFAQSQLTCQLGSLDGHDWHPAGWCNGQGRVLTTLLIHANSGQHIDCVVPRDQVDATIDRLQKFTIGRQVTLSAPQHIWGAWDLTTPDVARPLAFDSRRYLALADGQTATVDATAMQTWALADIEAGLCWLGLDVSGQFLPQALGLERLNGLSYTKGCYPGQEVIAKIHYRGQLKERLVRVTWPDNMADGQPGGALFTAPDGDDGSTKAVGRIINRQQRQGLAVVKTKVAVGQWLAVQPNGAAGVQILPVESGAPGSDLVS